jgi:hypothetical protein
MIVPGGGISLDGSRWVSCRPGFFLPVRVLSRLFHRLFLERLTAAHRQLQFFGDHAPVANAQAFAACLAPLRKTEWVVYCADNIARARTGSCPFHHAAQLRYPEFRAAYRDVPKVHFFQWQRWYQQLASISL